MSGENEADREKPRLEIDWVRTIAAALAAMTSTVLLSTLGAVGTVVGAAIGSLAVTFGTALYARGLARSRAAVAKVPVSPRNRGSVAPEPGVSDSPESTRAASRPLTTSSTPPPEEPHRFLAPDPVTDVPAGADPKDRVGGLPWKRIAIAAAALFVLVMGVVTVFELVSGKSLAAHTGGSDHRQTTLFGGGDDTDDDRKDKQDQDRDSDEDEPGQDDPDQDQPDQDQPDEVTPTDDGGDESGGSTEEPDSTAEPTDELTPNTGPTEEPTESASEEPSANSTEAPAPAEKSAPTEVE